MFILGIVGSPAGGKSTVAKRIQQLGAHWINADMVAHEVLAEPEIQRQLIDHFGNQITGPDGQIDRGKLASFVFGDDDASRSALNYLEGVIHPRTRQRIAQQLHECAVENVDALILDVPLLFKSGWDQACDEIWCVDASREIRGQRAADRGWDQGELERREANQTDIEVKKRLSNHVIVNDGTLDELHAIVDRLWQSFLDRYHDHTPPKSNHCL